MRKIEMIGKKFGRLTVESSAGYIYKRRLSYSCQCECGAVHVVAGETLRSGAVASCGCIVIELISSLNRTHGACDTREYRAWQHAKGRCYCVTDAKYPQYGGRGIRMCDSWLNSFEAFIADMGKCPAKKTLDRIDVNGHYEPNNCRWATNKEQMNNRQYHVRMPTGETLKQYAERTGQNYKSLHRIMRRKAKTASA